MNLTLSRRGDYVIRAALCLASAYDGRGSYRKIRQIAEVMELPSSYTPQVLRFLAKAGLAEAKAGREGGYRLTRRPEEISLLEVVEAAEGQLASERCPMRGGPCHWDDVCAVHPTWILASEAVRSTLADTTLAQVAETDRVLAAGKTIKAGPRGHRVPARPRASRKAAAATR